MSFAIIKNSLRKGKVTRSLDTSGLVCHAGLEEIGEELKRLIRAKFARSLHIREVDTGSCGACESEIIACSNPLYDVQRFGIDFVASPRHADALLVTGPVSKNMALALKKTYDAMPEPKFVITMGRCTSPESLFKDSYYTCDSVNDIVPVAFHIPGCPPTPMDIITSLLCFVKKS